MKIRKPCNLEKLYKGKGHTIIATSPELEFMTAVCLGEVDKALSFFCEKKLLREDPPAVDTPYGRFEGLDGIRDFVEGWHKKFNAQGAFITPVIQTFGGGRVCSEAVINFIVDGEIEQVPMLIVADFRTKTKLDEVRLYCHFTCVPGQQAYRHPIFKAAYKEIGEPNLLTGAVREYYEALGHAPDLDLERIVKTFSKDCQFGGYEPWGEEALPPDEETVRKKFKSIGEYMPSCVAIRFETIIDDGRNCVLEWVHIVSRKGQEERARIALSGIAVYERNEEGLICSVRICDYAHYERTIDWSKLPLTLEEARKINFVEEYSPTVGIKRI